MVGICRKALNKLWSTFTAVSISFYLPKKSTEIKMFDDNIFCNKWFDKNTNIYFKKILVFDNMQRLKCKIIENYRIRSHLIKHVLRIRFEKRIIWNKENHRDLPSSNQCKCEQAIINSKITCNTVLIYKLNLIYY